MTPKFRHCPRFQRPWMTERSRFTFHRSGSLFLAASREGKKSLSL
jgi:hypothetical protein